MAQVHAALAARREEWLLIFDNAPNHAALRGVLPPAGHGQVLITSQDPHWPGQAVEVPVLDADVAAAFLVSRTGSSGSADRTAAEELSVELGGLPLALEQARAYMQATGRSIAGYLAIFQQRRIDLLARGESAGYDKRVSTAWALAFDSLQQTAPEAIGLLRLIACCAPDHIPLHLLLQPHPRVADLLGPEVAPLLLPVLEDPLAADSAIAALRQYSLITHPVNGSVSVHRLVQAVTLAQLTPDKAQLWRQAARSLIDAALPADLARPEGWPICAALLPHVRITHKPMDEWILNWLAGAASLLVGQAPRATAELLRQAVVSSPAGSTGHSRLVGWLAEALYRIGDVAESEHARAFADRAVALAADSEVPHRLAHVHYCCGLLANDATRLLVASAHYRDAGRALLSAKALEAAAWIFGDSGDRDQAQAAFTGAVEVYTSLDAVIDIARLRLPSDP